MSGVTVGTLSPLLKTIGVVSKVGGGDGGLGFAGKGGATMSGPDHSKSRALNDAERTAIEAHAASAQLSGDALIALLGGETCDVDLNDAAYWRNVPAAV